MTVAAAALLLMVVTIGLGAAAAYSLLRGKTTQGLVLGAGTAYAYSRYRKSRNAERRRARPLHVRQETAALATTGGRSPLDGVPLFRDERRSTRLCGHVHRPGSLVGDSARMVIGPLRVRFPCVTISAP